MANDTPLFGDTFNTVEIPQLSIDSIFNNIPELPSIGETISVKQKPIDIPKFNFPLFPKNIDFNPNNKKQADLPLEDRIRSSVSKLEGNYRGEVSQVDATRYNDPYLGYNPDANNDDIYSSKGNFYSGLNGFWNNTVQWTKSGWNSIPSVFDAITEGDYTKLWDNDFNKEALINSEGLQYLYPIYKSKDAQDNPWNVFATGNLAENLTNVGMIAGTIISTISQDLAIAGAAAILAPETLGGSAVVGTGGLVVNTLKNVAQVYKNINSLSKVLSVPSLAKNAYTAVRGGENLVNVVKNAATVNNVFNASGQLIKTALVSSGEAGFEAYSVSDKVKKQLYEQNPNATQEDIDATTKAAGNLSYGLNQALLNITMPIQFGKLLTGKLLTSTLKDLPLKIVADTATGTLSMMEKKGFLNTFAGHYLKKLGEQILSEGGEEGLQFAIENGSFDYYKDKFKNVDEGLFNYVGKGLGSMFTDEGLANISGGAFIGGGGAVAGGLFGDVVSSKMGSDLSYKQYRNQTQKYKEAFDNTSNLFQFAQKTNEPITLKDGEGLFDVKNKYEQYVHDFAVFGIKQGNIDARIDALKEFKNATPEEFTKFSGINVENQKEIGEIVDSIVNRIKVTQDSYKEINNAFSVNPFSSDNAYREKIAKLANKSKRTERAINANIWEAAKDQAVKYMVDLKNKQDRDEDLSKEIQQGVLPQYHNLLESFLSSPLQTLNQDYSLNQTLNPFLKQVEEIIKQNEEIYGNLPKHLEEVISEKRNIENTKKFYESITDSIQNNNLKEFYTEFYKYISGDNYDEKNLNNFIINSTDVIKLRLGKEFLVNMNKKLQTKDGQRKPIESNIQNHSFYTYLDDLQEQANSGNIQTASVTYNGETTRVQSEVNTTTVVANPIEPIQTAIPTIPAIPEKEAVFESTKPLDLEEEYKKQLEEESINTTNNEILYSQLYAILDTEENYNNWSNVRDGSDKKEFFNAINSGITPIIESSKYITYDDIHEILKNIKAFQNRDIRDKVVDLLYRDIIDRFPNDNLNFNIENNEENIDILIGQFTTEEKENFKENLKNIITTVSNDFTQKALTDEALENLYKELLDLPIVKELVNKKTEAEISDFKERSKVNKENAEKLAKYISTVLSKKILQTSLEITDIEQLEKEVKKTEETYDGEKKLQNNFYKYILRLALLFSIENKDRSISTNKAELEGIIDEQDVIDTLDNISRGLIITLRKYLKENKQESNDIITKQVEPIIPEVIQTLEVVTTTINDGAIETTITGNTEVVNTYLMDNVESIINNLNNDYSNSNIEFYFC